MNSTESRHLRLVMMILLAIGTAVPAAARITEGTYPIPSSTDSDDDGLTDIEEALYGTDPFNSDTDGDSYPDGKGLKAERIVGELYTGFNPVGAGRILASGLMRSEEIGGGAKVLVPTSFSVKRVRATIIIEPNWPTGESFEIGIETRTAAQAPQAWYAERNPSANVALLVPITIDGLEGFYTRDTSAAYLFHDKQVVVFRYASGDLQHVNYRTTFETMVRSFKRTGTR